MYLRFVKCDWYAKLHAFSYLQFNNWYTSRKCIKSRLYKGLITLTGYLNVPIKLVLNFFIELTMWDEFDTNIKLPYY